MMAGSVRWLSVPGSVHPGVATGLSAPPTYRWGQTLWQMIHERAERLPDSRLVSDEKGNVLTAAEYRDRAERVAAGLMGLGVTASSIVSWQLPSNIESMLILAALCRLDATQNPLIMILREPEVEFITHQAGSQLLITSGHFRNYDHGVMAHSIAERTPGLTALVLAGVLPDADPAILPPAPYDHGDEVRWLYYTSGTTAEPKGARHRDRDLISGAHTFCDSLEPTAADKIASVAPMAHVGGVLFFLSALVSDASLIITEVFDPISTTKQLAEAGVTICGSGVPFIQGFLAQQRLDPQTKLLPDVKVFIVGGASRIESLHYQAKNELGGVGIVSGYGMTESPFMTFGRLDDSDWHHAMADGRPGPGVDLIIVKDDGTRALAGEAGEVRVKANTMMAGYVDPLLDETAFDDDGYFRTGDVAYLDAEGFLIISGRIKDVIIRNMENISAREVEIPLIDHPKVLIASVIGLPDELTGERVCAVVVPVDLAEAPTLDELCRYLREHGLNPRKLPVQLEIVDELPLNAMGKVMKQTLQQRFREKAHS
ncbi:MAG: putative acid--CoA ligase [Subtercola sp.]|nr:putative acid--CoA ligase [Subtercola sp.]